MEEPVQQRWEGRNEGRAAGTEANPMGTAQKNPGETSSRM